MDYPWTTDYLFKSQFKRMRFPSRVRFFTKITCHYKMSWWPMKNRYLKIGYPSHLTESWLKFQNHLKVMSGMGCRHSSVDLSALSILLPRVRLPSTKSCEQFIRSALNVCIIADKTISVYYNRKTFYMWMFLIAWQSGTPFLVGYNRLGQMNWIHPFYLFAQLGIKLIYL